MALLNPVPNSTIKQKFDGTFSGPAMYFQNHRGLPLAAFAKLFPGNQGLAPRYHSAIDYSAPAGTPIVASERCKVVSFGTWKDGAKWVKIAIRPTTKMEHWHLSRFRTGLFVGQIIPRGGILGYVGSTGNSTGNHDHAVLKITDLDPDGVRREYLYNLVRFLAGGDLANDARVKPYY